MDYILAAFFGIIQGLTEFLPISSSGHLLLMHRIFDIQFFDELTFDVILHLATLFSVIIYFKKDIFFMLRDWLKGLSGEKNGNYKLSWYIILATIPAALAGFFFEDRIETFFRSEFIVAIMLIAVGFLFIIVERFSVSNLSLNSLSWRKALAIGCAQALALIPGTSRSGITIISGMAGGLKRENAIRFSFYLSIPIIFGAFIVKIPTLLAVKLNGYELGLVSISFLFAFISGYLAISYLLRFSRNHSLIVFAWYRFILAGLILLFMIN
ncbi:undecaprenyl-diphosphatase UppP [bacterium]|nr:undecaprenyl-diphosphatase UppP [bacterium]